MMNDQKGKRRLETILRGGVPDAPPHFELQFLLPKEMFGMDIASIDTDTYGSEAARLDALEAFHREIAIRCVEEFGYAAVTSWYWHPQIDDLRAMKTLKKEVHDRALIFAFSDSGVIWMPFGGKEYEQFAVMMYEHPEELHAQAKRKVAACKELTVRQIDAGVDFIIQNTDFGLNTGPFISPKKFLEYCTPYMAELIEFMHDKKLPVIMHSDGNLNSILDQLHSTGVDGYQSIDPQGMMDIKAVRELYPEWILMGNVNCAMLQEADEAQIRRSVQYCMKYGGIGKRYIFSTSNTIYDGMPPESYRIMLDEYHNCIAATISTQMH